jgi:nitrile hydratase subunit beta
MNGVHDMGGMHGFGPIQHEINEPVFHEPWEARLVGMRNVASLPRERPGSFRYDLETLDPVFYLTASYYERWLETFVGRLIRQGLITPEELASRIDFYTEDPAAPVPTAQNPDQATAAVARLHQRARVKREAVGTARFNVGDRVRARNIHPSGHTRMPRYVRGKQGVVRAFYGFHGFQDFAPGDPIDVPPQPVYSVQFSMQELWGASAEPSEHLYIDLWESHLDPA